jgi:hypothetical protein
MAGRIVNQREEKMLSKENISFIEDAATDNRHSDAYVGNMVRANWHTPLKTGIGDTLKQAHRMKEGLEFCRARFHGLAAAVAVHISGEKQLNIEELLKLLQEGNAVAYDSQQPEVNSEKKGNNT